MSETLATIRPLEGQSKSELQAEAERLREKAKRLLPVDYVRDYPSPVHGHVLAAGRYAGKPRADFHVWEALQAIADREPDDRVREIVSKCDLEGWQPGDLPTARAMKYVGNILKPVGVAASYALLFLLVIEIFRLVA